MEAEALGDAYVPPARFVSLLKRLEARRCTGGEAGAKAAADDDAAQRTPSPASYNRYTVAVRTAPARTPALARSHHHHRGGSPAPAPSDDGGLDLGKLADGAKEEATQLAMLRHDHAVDAYGERKSRVDAALAAERRMDFYVTTAEADARRRNEQDPSAGPGDSNYDAIAEKLGLNRDRNGHGDFDDLEAESGRSPAPAPPVAAPAALPNFAMPPPSAGNAAPSLRTVGSGLAKLQKTASKIRIAAALGGSTNSNSVRGGSAIEPQEFANLRNRLAETEATMADMKADYERRLQEAALRADLESQALRVEAEERAEALVSQLSAARDDSRKAREQTEQAQQEVQRMSGFERDVSRLGALLEVARSERREVDATVADLRREVELLPTRVEERTASIAADKAAVEDAKASLERDLATATAALAERNAQLRALQEELAAALETSVRADAARLDEVAARERAEQQRLQASEELKNLDAQKANFEDQARDKMRQEIDDALAQAKMKSDAYEAVFREKVTAEMEVARLKEIADAFDVQRKTLKRATRDLSQAREQIGELREANAKSMERRLHHIFTNIALKLNLARVLRPDGLQDRLVAAEKQNAWLYARLEEATAMAKKRLQPNKAPPPRLVQRLPEEEAALVASAADEAAREGREAEREAAEAAAAAATWVVDSSVQTDALVLDAGSRFNSGSSGGHVELRSPQAWLDAETARRTAAAAHRASAVSTSQIETSTGPGRLTERGLKLAADEALRKITNAPNQEEDRVESDQHPNNNRHQHPRDVDATRTRDMRGGSRGIPRPLSAASRSDASAARVVRRQQQLPSPEGIPPARRANSASASSRRPRPSSALSMLSGTSSAAEVRVEPPAVPNLLVVGTQGPLAGALVSNPYNYFGTAAAAAAAAVASPDGATAATAANDDGWVPTHYAVGSLPPTSACGSAVPSFGAAGHPAAAWRPPSATSVAASTRQQHGSSFPYALTDDAYEEQQEEEVLYRRCDDPAASRVAGVTPMAVAAPVPKLPGGAWARGQGANPPRR